MKYKLIICILIFLSFPFALFSQQEPYEPYFSGSILALPATNMKQGQSTFAPYVVFSNTYGEYKSWWNVEGDSNQSAINPFFEYLYGITDNIGIELYVSFISSFKKGQSATHFQDSIAVLGFQISNDIPGTWIPDFRIDLEEIIPTGKYQKLDPKKLGIDATGQGSWQTGFDFIVQKKFPTKNHFLLLKWTLGYIFPASVHVRNLNAYGGGPGTKGKANPGKTLNMFFSGEYSITQNWVFAFDLFFFRQGKATFSGKKGKNSDDTLQKIGLPYSYQLSFAPQIEYNFSPNSGILIGFWASLIGKNTAAFYSGILAYYIVF
ncbi:hypothetical protein [Simkania negevensis]|uniref:Transporter n=1 Tax=Simkania negevensis (strain ATCC VR-1471 / DSM 27360 / Z) TaxID=331113 RepID=F8L4K3_SIMNZ|nr:hypothetical protein [Simkania negevensis]CCB90259.1 putative uncharacterized protein [Simkania negevensis Z]